MPDCSIYIELLIHWRTAEHRDGCVENHHKRYRNGKFGFADSTVGVFYAGDAASGYVSRKIGELGEEHSDE